MRISKLVITALTAALVLALGVGAASASNGVSVDNTSTRATSARLTFADGSGSFRVVCEVVLTISLHRTIAKSAGTLAGFITAVEVRNCSGGNARVLNASLPWHVTYVSFEGTLPNITSVRLQLNGAAFLLEAFFRAARCLYRGNPQGTTGGSPVNEIRADGSRTIALFEEALSSISCPRTGRFEGTFSVSPTVRLTLI